jgi:hypothetical protein
MKVGIVLLEPAETDLKDLRSYLIRTLARKAGKPLIAKSRNPWA